MLFVKFGSGKNKANLSESDFQKLLVGLKKYDKDDVKQHQKKLWCLVGLSTGTRGQEQCLLEVRHIVCDILPPEHPKGGMVFYALVGLNHKRGKLTTTSLYADEDDLMKMLMYDLKENSLCAAGCLDCYLKKLSLGQLRLYCCVKKDGTMSPNQPLGRNTCSKMVKEVAVDCGIEDIDRFKPHVFRRLFITHLINDPHLSLSEVMAAGRHKSVAASLAYQRRSGKSEAAKFDAVKNALKHGLDNEEKDMPENKKMKVVDGMKGMLKSDVVEEREEGEEDVHDDDAKDSAIAVPSAKADSSSSFSSERGVASGSRPVLFTFHFN